MVNFGKRGEAIRPREIEPLIRRFMHVNWTMADQVVVSGVNFVWNKRSATTLAWLCALMCVWNTIVGSLACRFLTANWTLFARRLASTWLIPSMAFPQLRNF